VLKTRVSYTIKDNKGFLIEVERTFMSDAAAAHFIRTLNSLPGIKIIGRPLMENVGKNASL